MVVELPYGRDRLAVRFGAGLDVTVVSKPTMPALPAPADAVRRALAEPTTGPPLAAAAQGARSACVLVCDITRPVPNRALLRPVLETLLAAGIRADAITVLIATGLHRATTTAELREVIGDDWVLGRFAVLNHDARADGDHVDLGATRSGTPVGIDARFAGADLRIATGLVEPHFMAGYSGGRKVVVPGAARADTIRTLHSDRFLAQPRTRTGILEGNPLHEELLAIVRLLGPTFAVNTVIDDRRRLSFVNFGPIEASHAEAVAFAGQYLVVPVPRRFRTVVTSAAGFPLDATYYQAVKGMVTPIDIVAQDATLVLAAECGAGLGSPAYRHAQRRLRQHGGARFLASLRGKSMADVDEWETRMQLKAQGAARVQLMSGLGADDRALTGVDCVDSVEGAVARSVAASGDPAVAVIPEGPYVVPRVTPAEVAA